MSDAGCEGGEVDSQGAAELSGGEAFSAYGTRELCAHLAERSIAWLVRNNRRCPCRSTRRNRLWLTARAAAVSLQRPVNLGRLVNLGLAHTDHHWAITSPPPTATPPQTAPGGSRRHPAAPEPDQRGPKRPPPRQHSDCRGLAVGAGLTRSRPLPDLQLGRHRGTSGRSDIPRTGSPGSLPVERCRTIPAPQRGQSGGVSAGPSAVPAIVCAVVGEPSAGVPQSLQALQAASAESEGACVRAARLLARHGMLVRFRPLGRGTRP